MSPRTMAIGQAASTSASTSSVRPADAVRWVMPSSRRAVREFAPPAQKSHFCRKLVLFRDSLPDRLPVMPTTRTLAGRLKQFERPDWDPLIELVGLVPVRSFMWMNEIELEDGTSVHAYKHIWTRHYVHAAGDGRVFEYRRPGRYREVDAGRRSGSRSSPGCRTTKTSTKRSKRCSTGVRHDSLLAARAAQLLRR